MDSNQKESHQNCRINHSSPIAVQKLRLKIKSNMTGGAAPESSPAISKNPVKLPESYQMLDKFFGSLESSIRLLLIKGSGTTFGNIRPKIECLTDRRFTLSHLAQIKHILPEAIEIKETLVLDEYTRSMKPDLHISLNAQAVQDSRKPLRKVFRARLVRFFNAHPDGDEIPEGYLNHDLFNPTNTKTPVKDVHCSYSETGTQPLKRTYMIPGAGEVFTQQPNKLRRRSLSFDTPEKNAENDVQESSAVARELLEVLPGSLVQSIKEKEKMAQARWRRQMIARLPQLFDMICALSISMGKNMINKDEIVKRMINRQINIVDEREAREQLKLLVELLPECIYEKSSLLSGEVLLCLKYMYIRSPELLRKRLAEAK